MPQMHQCTRVVLMTHFYCFSKNRKNKKAGECLFALTVSGSVRLSAMHPSIYDAVSNIVRCLHRILNYML